MEYLTHRLGFFPTGLTYYQVALAGRFAPFTLPSGEVVTNERMEFLGDAVLELVVSNYIFRRFPTRQEGDLTRLRTKLVCGESLAKFAKLIGFTELLERRYPSCQLTQNMLSNLMEAFLGAIYLDVGFTKAREIVEQNLLSKHIAFDDLLANLIDDKSRLMEWAQRNHRVVTFRTSPDPHNPQRKVCRLHIDGKYVASGVASTHKDAEKYASAQALQELAGNDAEG